MRIVARCHQRHGQHKSMGQWCCGNHVNALGFWSFTTRYRERIAAAVGRRGVGVCVGAVAILLRGLGDRGLGIKWACRQNRAWHHHDAEPHHDSHLWQQPWACS